MLDALVTEARLRFGLDPAAGLQVVAAERLIATPLEASRPVLVVPLALLRPGADDRASAVSATPLPVGTGRAAARRSTSSPGPYPADHRSAASGPPTADDGRRPDATTTSRRRSTSRRVAPEAAVAGPWAMPAISDRLRAPDGCPWDREQTHAVAAQAPARGGLRGLRRARGRARRRSWPASSVTCCSRSCSTPSWRPRPACST